MLPTVRGVNGDGLERSGGRTLGLDEVRTERLRRRARRGPRLHARVRSAPAPYLRDRRHDGRRTATSPASRSRADALSVTRRDKHSSPPAGPGRETVVTPAPGVAGRSGSSSLCSSAARPGELARRCPRPPCSDRTKTGRAAGGTTADSRPAAWRAAGPAGDRHRQALVRDLVQVTDSRAGLRGHDQPMRVLDPTRTRPGSSIAAVRRCLAANSAAWDHSRDRRIVAGAVLGVERRLWKTTVQDPIADFADLVVERIVERQRARVAPESIEPVATRRGPRAYDLEDRAGDVERTAARG